MRGVMAVYQRYSFEQEKRRALELWASFLKSLTIARESNVVRQAGGGLMHVRNVG
jgi:hypothetical protein